MIVRLFVNIYKDQSEERSKEIFRAFCANLDCKVIDHVVAIYDPDSFEASPDLMGRSIPYKFYGRPRFSDFFNIMRFFEPNEEDISIAANSDIIFPGTSIELIKSNLKDDQAYALSRWEQTEAGPQLFDRRDSQDSWAMKGAIADVPNCYFTMGLGGCDNAIASRLYFAGYNVLNPSKDIVTLHEHKSEIRYWTQKYDPVPKPYLLIQPHKLNETPQSWHI